MVFGCQFWDEYFELFLVSDVVNLPTFSKTSATFASLTTRLTQQTSLLRHKSPGTPCLKCRILSLSKSATPNCSGWFGLTSSAASAMRAVVMLGRRISTWLLCTAPTSLTFYNVHRRDKPQRLDNVANTSLHRLWVALRRAVLLSGNCTYKWLLALDSAIILFTITLLAGA